MTSKTKLKNALNFYNEKPDSDISVLANYDAVVFYANFEKNPDEFNIYNDLISKNIKFYACANALKANKINNIDSKIEIVPAGVVKLAQLQSEGYAYIKP